MQFFTRLRDFRIILMALLLCSILNHADADADADAEAEAEAEQEVGIGVYSKPEFQGADEYETIVLPSAITSLGPIGITLRGVELQADLVPSKKLNAGLLLRYDEGRAKDVSDLVVGKLQPVESSLEAGLFLQSGIPVQMLGINDPALIIGSIDMTGTFGAGHGGTLVSVSLGLFRDLTSSISIVGRFLLTYADAEYNNAFFGVSRTDSAVSSLSEYKADAGIKDTGLDIVLNKRLDDHWSGGITISYKRFSDVLEDSPVIRIRGSEEYWTGGLFATYGF